MNNRETSAVHSNNEMVTKVSVPKMKTTQSARNTIILIQLNHQNIEKKID